jgi:hypothetical protein
MKQRRRIYYSAAQRSEIWDRWQAGEQTSSQNVLQRSVEPALRFAGSNRELANTEPDIR